MPLRVDIRAPAEPRALGALLQGMTALDEHQMAVAEQAGEPLPALYASGVSYEREAGTERWQTARELLASRRGDCEDLSSYRAAELRRGGEGAVVEVVPAESRRGYHAVVRRADGTIEDPSRVLQERESPMSRRNTVIDVREDGSCYVGEVEVPTAEGSLTTRGEGNTGADALERAADLAERVMADPAIAAFVPPQAHAAVAGARLLARAARSGVLASAFGRLTGQHKRRLARVLLDSTPSVGSLSIGADHRRPRAGGRPTSRSPVDTSRGGYEFVDGAWRRKLAPPSFPGGGYPSDPYAWPPYYGAPMPPDPYGGGVPYGGYPPMDPWGGYGPYAPVDPWAQYQGYGWGQPASPWEGVDMAAQFGSQALDALWPQLRAAQGGGW